MLSASMMNFIACIRDLHANFIHAEDFTNENDPTRLDVPHACNVHERRIGDVILSHCSQVKFLTVNRNYRVRQTIIL
jgi:hypothetical protein